jgi:hypothetical protein
LCFRSLPSLLLLVCWWPSRSFHHGAAEAFAPTGTGIHIHMHRALVLVAPSSSNASCMRRQRGTAIILPSTTRTRTRTRSGSISGSENNNEDAGPIDNDDELLRLIRGPLGAERSTIEMFPKAIMILSDTTGVTAKTAVEKGLAQFNGCDDRFFTVPQQGDGDGVSKYRSYNIYSIYY